MNQSLQSPSEHKFEATFNSGVSLKVILDDDLRILEYNRAFSNYFNQYLQNYEEGWKVQDLEMFEKSNIKNLELALAQCDKGKDQQYLDNFKADGKNCFFEMFINPVFENDSAQPDCYVVNMRDVTEMERQKTALSESRLKIDQQEGEFRKMAHLVSHDLRAPATNLSYLIDLLEKSEEKEEEVMEGLKVSVKRILDTIGQVGSDLNEHLEKVDSDERTSLRAAIDEALDGHQENIKNHSARVIVDLYDNSEWGIDWGVLKMALDQLIDNSLKYSRSGENPKIEIRAYRKDGERIVEVKDNGIGIDLEGQEQRLFGLFQTFHQHPQARGVGLFQVKNRLKALGGDVVLESQLGKGTTVFLNFK